ncbi:c-type cytochrome [Terricaulis sp.]|uniref:c-type cytochrome n=1 Tax=Terricaulis sp. TaxID=2768686 RepID=UPI0037834384
MLKAVPLMALAFVALAAAACTTQTQLRFEPLTPSERTALIEEGREIATSQCGSCHAVGLADASPRPGAPPLRSVLERYDSAALTGNLMIGVRVGHLDMPLFEMGPRGADALVEYLYSIRSTNQQVPER